jgi:hypothetical protein
MLNFTKFLAEVFYKGVDSYDGYCEVWRNPTDNELIQSAGGRPRAGYQTAEDLIKKFGKNCYYIGALVTSKAVYCFNRDEFSHSAAMGVLKDIPDDLLTLYLYYFPYSNSIGVSTSGFSSPKQPPPAKTLMPRLRAMPWFRRFDNVWNYDEERNGARR